MVSCQGNKVLFTDVPEKLYVEIPEAVIQVGDILDINITSLNSQSTSIFSPTSLGKIGTIRNLEARKLDGYMVDRLGYIDIPIIGKIHVAAMSCSSISDSIKSKSREYVLNPNVRVKVLNFRVSVLGEVNSPGTYDVINQKISLLIDCGVDDFLIETNRQMHSLLMEKKIPHDYIERPGAHTWNYWTEALPVQFFFLSKSLKR